MDLSDQVEIEKIGGLAGIGLPGSRIRSRALLKGSELNAAERACISALFSTPAKAHSSAQTGADNFRYRITLQKSSNHRQIEVNEKELVESLRARVHDELT